MNWFGRVFLIGFVLSCTNIFAQTLNSEDKDWSYFVTTDDRYAYIKIMDTYSKIRSAAYDNNTTPADTRTYKYIEYGNGCFIIMIKSDRVYKFIDKPFKPWSDGFISIAYYDFGEKKWHSRIGSYFNVNGSPIRYAIEIKSDNVIEEKMGDSTYYTFTREGVASFIVTIGEISHQIDIQVISLPIRRYSPVDTVIETIGFPDKDLFEGVDWPRNEFRHGFSLAPYPGGSIYKHFYFFKEYPYLVLSMLNGEIDDISYAPIEN
jgi:hypothetical protein